MQTHIICGAFGVLNAFESMCLFLLMSDRGPSWVSAAPFHRHKLGPRAVTWAETDSGDSCRSLFLQALLLLHWGFLDTVFFELILRMLLEKHISNDDSP